MTHRSSIARRQQGSVRLALLCTLAGAAAVFVWRGLQPAVPARANPTDGRATGEAQGEPSSILRPDALAPGQTQPPRPLQPPTAGSGPPVWQAAETPVDATTLPDTDADGFSPDYGALVDEFQQQRQLDPLIDD